MANKSEPEVVVLKGDTTVHHRIWLILTITIILLAVAFVVFYPTLKETFAGEAVKIAPIKGDIITTEETKYYTLSTVPYTPADFFLDGQREISGPYVYRDGGWTDYYAPGSTGKDFLRISGSSPEFDNVGFYYDDESIFVLPLSRQFNPNVVPQEYYSDLDPKVAIGIKILSKKLVEAKEKVEVKVSLRRHNGELQEGEKHIIKEGSTQYFYLPGSNFRHSIALLSKEQNKINYLLDGYKFPIIAQGTADAKKFETKNIPLFDKINVDISFSEYKAMKGYYFTIKKNSDSCAGIPNGQIFLSGYSPQSFPTFPLLGYTNSICASGKLFTCDSNHLGDTLEDELLSGVFECTLTGWEIKKEATTAPAPTAPSTATTPTTAKPTLGVTPATKTTPPATTAVTSESSTVNSFCDAKGPTVCVERAKAQGYSDIATNPEFQEYLVNCFVYRGVIISKFNNKLLYGNAGDKLTFLSSWNHKCETLIFPQGVAAGPTNGWAGGGQVYYPLTEEQARLCIDNQEKEFDGFITSCPAVAPSTAPAPTAPSTVATPTTAKPTLGITPAAKITSPVATPTATPTPAPTPTPTPAPPTEPSIHTITAQGKDISIGVTEEVSFKFDKGGAPVHVLAFANVNVPGKFTRIHIVKGNEVVSYLGYTVGETRTVQLDTAKEFGLEISVRDLNSQTATLLLKKVELKKVG